MSLPITSFNSGYPVHFNRLLLCVPNQKASVQGISDGDRFNGLQCVGGTVSNIIRFQGQANVLEFIRINNLSKNTHKGATDALQLFVKDRRHSGPHNTISLIFFSSWAKKIGEEVRKNDQLSIWGDDVIATRDPVYVGGAAHSCHIIITSLVSAHNVSNTVGPSVHVLLSSMRVFFIVFIEIRNN